MASESKDRINFSSGSPWEPLRGFSRAVRVGESLYISGTTAMMPDGQIAGGSDPYEQTRAVIRSIKEILSGCGFELSDVVRTRLYVTNMARWEDYARAHSEAFDTIRPASSIVQVTKLVDARILLEMEVDAVRGCVIKEQVKLSL